MRVAVIGAGASGLAAGKALREVGLSPVIFEASSRVGGLWVYREHGTGPAYRSLRTNTSRHVTGFSDAPFSAHLPNFPGHEAVEDYLCQYAAQFDLIAHIVFDTTAQAVIPLDDGRWLLEVRSPAGERIEVFDGVMVCAGIFRETVLPVVPGLDQFPGRVIHSVDYRTPEVFAGQRVLVVGLGSSAVDIAADLMRTAASVTLSTRRGAVVTPREIAGRPLDHYGSRLVLSLPERVRASWRRRLIVGEYGRRRLPLPEVLWQRTRIPFDATSAPSVVSDDLVPLIAGGNLNARPGLERFSASDAIFVDGSRVHLDAVIFCTGYDLSFPFLAPGLAPWRGVDAGLFRLVFPPDHPTLAFIGVCRVQGPVFPIVEMQARWAARVLNGQVALPPPAAMRAEIDRRRQNQERRQDSVIRVPLLPYLDELAAEIHVRPRLWRNPILVKPLLTGPPLATQFRLEGPDSWADAPAILRAQQS